MSEARLTGMGNSDGQTWITVKVQGKIIIVPLTEDDKEFLRERLDTATECTCIHSLRGASHCECPY